MRGTPAPVGREKPKSSWSSAGRTSRMRTAVCPTTLAASSKRNRAFWSPTQKRSARSSRSSARTGCEAIGISPDKKTVQLRDVATGEVTTESYDKLVLSPGRASIRPPLPGIDLPGIFQVRTVPDAREIREWIERGRQLPLRDAQVFGVPDREAQNPSRGRRRRVHRPGDGGEPRASRVRRDPGGDARPGPPSARPGNGAHCRGPPGAAWRPSGAQ